MFICSRPKSRFISGLNELIFKQQSVAHSYKNSDWLIFSNRFNHIIKYLDIFRGPKVIGITHSKANFNSPEPKNCICQTVGVDKFIACVRWEICLIRLIKHFLVLAETVYFCKWQEAKIMT